MEAKEIFEKMDLWFSQNQPFFFLLDYKMKEGECMLLENVDPTIIQYHAPIAQNSLKKKSKDSNVKMNTFPESFATYLAKFEQVKKVIQKGDSYLLNLTCETPIQINKSLEEIYSLAQSKYKLYYKNKFVHFSPETFVFVSQNKIATFPMKGTIDASLENAEQQILEDYKEKTEQYIITDLLRNDLSIVADQVEVKKFRYTENIITNNKPLLQVSTHIEGNIKPEFSSKIGTLLQKILPAGSICGAPKQKTMEWIDKIENHNRGFYTGVWGVFDGKRFDSCVIIRMIEKKGDSFVFKSGGGITSHSEAKKEYQEMLDKIYVPIY